MNFDAILKLWRKRLDDEQGNDSKRLWQDWEGAAFASDAEREICRELWAIDDSDTIGYIKLSGVAGQVDSVAVSGVTITSAAVPFRTNLKTTASDLAANINAFTSSPEAYRAVPRGTMVVIRANPGETYPAAGYLISSTYSAGMTVVATDLPGLCRHVLAIGQRYLPIHEKVIKIRRFKPAGQSGPAEDYTDEDYDNSIQDWEKHPVGTISGFIPNYDQGEIIVVPPPKAAECIEVTVYRYPLFDFSADDLDAYPEIGEKYHMAIVDWMLRQAYLKNDVETLDFNRSTKFEGEFNRRIEDFKRQKNKTRAQTQMNRVPGAFH